MSIYDLNKDMLINLILTIQEEHNKDISLLSKVKELAAVTGKTTDELIQVHILNKESKLLSNSRIDFSYRKCDSCEKIFDDKLERIYCGCLIAKHNLFVFYCKECEIKNTCSFCKKTLCFLKMSEANICHSCR